MAFLRELYEAFTFIIEGGDTYDAKRFGGAKSRGQGGHCSVLVLVLAVLLALATAPTSISVADDSRLLLLTS